MLSEMATVVFGGNFPSHHTMYSFILAFSIWVYYQRIGYMLMILALIIGLWRIFGGFHTPLEVLGGFGLSVMSVFTVNVVVFWSVHGK
jgi:undecaprenyl-diphosphatase